MKNHFIIVQIKNKFLQIFYLSKTFLKIVMTITYKLKAKIIKN